jgi:uncharacterized protein
VKYLFDVSTLVALAYAPHAFHRRAAVWFSQHRTRSGFFTCSIVELGFLRAGLNTGLCPDLALAQSHLAVLKLAAGIELLPDALGADALPAYVKKAKDTTDGHLLALARRHGARLVTFDTGIPGAELVP